MGIRNALGVIQMLKKFRQCMSAYPEKNEVVKLDLRLIFKTFGLLLILIIIIMLILAQLLPEDYFGISKTTMIIYFGSSISGVGAFCAILISYIQNREILEENRKNIRSERIDSMKPFITLESINLPCEGLPTAQIQLSVTRSLNERGESVLLFENYNIDRRWSNPQFFRFNLNRTYAVCSQPKKELKFL